jgi:hypothetical protein
MLRQCLYRFFGRISEVSDKSENNVKAVASNASSSLDKNISSKKADDILQPFAQCNGSDYKTAKTDLNKPSIDLKKLAQSDIITEVSKYHELKITDLEINVLTCYDGSDHTFNEPRKNII